MPYYSLVPPWSRSTWACELKCFLVISTSRKTASRSTWACELKSCKIYQLTNAHVTLHVSVWVEIVLYIVKRLTTLVTLHVSVWVEIVGSSSVGGSSVVTLHVSVWVEITILFPKIGLATSHAPRERVSWNATFSSTIPTYIVTLHVSVWVEIV